MSKIKNILPMLIVLLLVIVGLFFVNGKFSVKDYQQKMDDYNKQIAGYNHDIDVYKKAMQDKSSAAEDVNYIFDDGNEIIDLELSIIKEYAEWFKTHPNSMDYPDLNLKSRKILEDKFSLSSSDLAGGVFNPWYTKSDVDIRFVPDVSSNAEDIDVVWLVYYKNELVAFVKGSYNKEDRLYSDVTYNSIVQE